MGIGTLFIIFGGCLVFELIRVLINDNRSTAYKTAYVILVIIAILLGTKIYSYVGDIDPVAKTQEAQKRTREVTNSHNENRQFDLTAEQDEICHEMETVIAAVEKYRASEGSLPKSFAELAAKSKPKTTHKFDYNIRKDVDHRHRHGFWHWLWQWSKFYELSCIDSEGNKFYYTNGNYDFMDSLPLSKIRWVDKIAIIWQEEPELKPTEPIRKVRKLEPIIPGTVHFDEK